jgi:uncharacterized coiled-coil protein SlyX
METTDKSKQQINESSNKMNYSGHKESWMKRNGELIFALAIILIVGAGAFLLVYHHQKSKEYSELESQYQNLSGQLGVRDSLINDWVNLFDQVEKSLQTIKEKEKVLSKMKSEDMELAADKKETILHDIQSLNTMLAENKQKIAQLNVKLKSSGMKIAGLEKKVDELSFTLEQRNQSIDSLKSYLVEKDFELAQLNTKLTDIEADAALKQTTIDNQTAELRKGYLASGTYKELKEKGLINKEGGFLGIGRTTSLRDNVKAGNFTEVDITQTTSIPVNSKKVELITEHPSNSYEMVKGDNNLIASIKITDPDEFWRISKYAVIETVK